MVRQRDLNNVLQGNMLTIEISLFLYLEKGKWKNSWNGECRPCQHEMPLKTGFLASNGRGPVAQYIT